ncbi:ArsR/SmtB family transcription factor [Halanaerobium salsuginis]|uniref:Transcriptional regulator, ArsR family n=1 Tax=Halanaerobium salsuginis TaxID=29563 RepID=A0A1I4ENT8_9FIRM|nr:metalloregulator ArsR/SmtB family transcription factor [Halanaerobium salsuginis]SFL07344.1 transcriptional regulator, ArsR family [Halanaerobium salsuginis]
MDLMKVLKALSHQNRIRILNLLQKQQLCVCEIENIMQINQSNASRHLNKLKQAGLIYSNQAAHWVYYYLNNKLIAEHTFLNNLFTEETLNLEICQLDELRLQKYNKSNLTCVNLSNDTSILDKI